MRLNMLSKRKRDLLYKGLLGGGAMLNVNAAVLLSVAAYKNRSLSTGLASLCLAVGSKELFSKLTEEVSDENAEVERA